MIIIVCVDDECGMMFNNRRQSRDFSVCEDIMKLAGNVQISMNQYSKGLFTEYGFQNVNGTDDFLKAANDGGYYFIEQKITENILEQAEQIILYKWNRRYPGDVFFDVSLSDKTWELTNICEFPGKSHEKITREIYKRR